MQHIDVPAELRQYAVAVQDPNFVTVFNWVVDHKIPYELHAARLRFRPHTELLRTQFYLQYLDLCYPVQEPYPTVF